MNDYIRLLSKMQLFSFNRVCYIFHDNSALARDLPVRDKLVKIGAYFAIQAVLFRPNFQ